MAPDRLDDVQYHNNISERMLRAFAEARKVLCRQDGNNDERACNMCAESTFMILPKSVWHVIPEKSAVQTVACASAGQSVADRILGLHVFMAAKIMNPYLIQYVIS